MDVILTSFLGFLLRLGLPLSITILILMLLRRLDNQWQKEARALPVAPCGKRCWEIKGCSEEKKKDCLAFNQPNLPCWQVFRANDGVMKETCLGCEVFRQAPVPVQI